MSKMTGPVYCEQTLQSGFFEPINTITNSAFIIAGFFMIFQLKKTGIIDFKGWFLSSILIIIGLGSLAWHLYRNNATLWADSLPIAIFVLTYLFFYLKFTTKKSWHRILLFISFFIYTPVLSIFLDIFEIGIFDNGGASYFSAITYLLLVQIYNYYNERDVIKKSLIIIGLFLLSLFFRQIDLYVCEYTGFGTHFIWHILNALTLYLMIRLLYHKKIL